MKLPFGDRLFSFVMCDIGKGECIASLASFVVGLVLLAPAGTLALSVYVNLRFLPENVWAAIFLVCSAFSSVALWKDSRLLRRRAQFLQFSLFAFWGTELVTTTPQALSGWIWLVLSLSCGWTWIKLRTVQPRSLEPDLGPTHSLN